MNPDSDNHLGNSSFLTDAAGQPYQFIISSFWQTFTEQPAEWATP